MNQSASGLSTSEVLIGSRVGFNFSTSSCNHSGSDSDDSQSSESLYPESLFVQTSESFYPESLFVQSSESDFDQLCPTSVLFILCSI